VLYCTRTTGTVQYHSFKFLAQKQDKKQQQQQQQQLVRVVCVGVNVFVISERTQSGDGTFHNNHKYAEKLPLTF
jgi:hypothetical protein